jgi:hypothetical protein
MTAMDESIAAINSRKPGENFTYQSIADQYGVNRITLSQRHRGCQGSRRAEGINRRALSPQQELELCKYIEDLTSKGLPPTRKMIQNFASQIAPEPVGEHWVTRFLHQNRKHLVSKWTASMDCNRHQADSKYSYNLYFDLLQQKIEKYDIQPRHTYNMDGKRLHDWCHRTLKTNIQPTLMGA